MCEKTGENQGSCENDERCEFGFVLIFVFYVTSRNHREEFPFAIEPTYLHKTVLIPRVLNLLSFFLVLFLSSLIFL